VFAALYHRRELVWILVQRNLKIRYKHSALGFFWSLLTPLLMILMYAVFASILKFNTGSPRYLPFLVTGIVVWQFTAGCLNDSLASIAGSSNLVKKVYFPRVILPVSTVLANAINFLLTFAVLLVYLLATGVANFSAAYWLLAGFAMQLALGTGVACLCATSNVFFRDTQHIVGIGSLAWFFLSPVFYNLELQLGALAFLPPKFAGIVYLNPMSGILAAYRAGLMGLPPTAEIAPGEPLSAAWILLSAAVCLVVFAIGAAAVRAGERHFGDVL
jgi:lipopolysaccharide transport system permease protein